MEQKKASSGENVGRKKSPKRSPHKKSPAFGREDRKGPDQFEAMNGIESTYFKKA